MRKFENGATVYINGVWIKEEECEVLDCIENESRTGQNVYNVRSKNYGMFFATEDSVFATKNEAHKASVEATDKLVQKYKMEIKTLKDLLEFPLHHCISGGEEYTEWEAQRAYRLRANELTDLILGEEWE